MTPQALRDEVDELAVLLPALPDALPRDSGTNAGERVFTSGDVHSIPINPDVAIALRNLPHAGSLEAVANEYAAAYNEGRADAARRLADQVAGWLRIARAALRLDKPDTPLPGPQHCPDHDRPLTPLVVPGDRGHLDYDRLDPTGHPVGAWIRWEHHDLVMCRHCKRTWTPAQYPWLGRLVRYAEHRRAAGRPPHRGDAA